MRSLLTAQQMKEADAFAIRRCGIPSLLLMEHAGQSVIEEIERVYGNISGKSFLIVCGRGNNGGDGFVGARFALQKNAYVTLLFLESIGSLTPDAKINYQILKGIRSANLVEMKSIKRIALKKAKYDFIIDALFGTSFRGKLSHKYSNIVQWINDQKSSTIVAVDIPSGLNATNGMAEGDAVKADLTVTMAAPKTGLYIGRGKELSGNISIADIQIPQHVLENNSDGVVLVEPHDVAKNLPRRSPMVHKYSVGKIFVLAGSKGLSGAALLSSLSALRSGAGAVILGVPSPIFPAVAKRTLEVMPFELPATIDGSVALNSLPIIFQKVRWADVVLIGPGLSRNQETQNVIREIVRTAPCPIVIDADGLNAIAADASALKKRKSRGVVLTPHWGEFSRLSGFSSTQIAGNELNVSRKFAMENNVVLVLKGAPTIVAESSGKIFVNSTGNAGMATAGSGDVLGGIIAALIGQGNSTLLASINGVYVHGMAGDAACKRFGEKGLIARDIIKEIPTAFTRLGEKTE
jgi:ADP-dependent NAD(P)H-hydrate dehydratase / NAD(P)H-hydrate epimerase